MTGLMLKSKEAKFEQKTGGPTQISVNSQPLPKPANAIPDDERQELHDRFETFARVHKYKIKPDPTAANYRAFIRDLSGNVTIVEANKDNVALSSRDANNNKTIPGYEYFDEIADMGKDRGINFMPGMDDEFKARLVLSCMKRNPPVKMTNSPTLDANFLNGIDPFTKAALEKLINPQQPQQQQPGPIQVSQGPLPSQPQQQRNQPQQTGGQGRNPRPRNNQGGNNPRNPQGGNPQGQNPRRPQGNNNYQRGQGNYQRGGATRP